MNLHESVGLHFRTTNDGRILFFPCGYWGRSYVLASPQDYDRLRRQLGIYQFFCALLAVVLIRQNWIVGCSVIALVIAFTAVWMRRLVAGLERTNERLSPRECWTQLAVRYGVFRLWAVEMIALVFIGTCIMLLVSGRGEWPMLLLMVLFSGLGAAISGYMLVLRRRALSPSS
jgi:hypothetical protein